MRWRQQVTKDALRRDMMGRAAAIERELEEAKEKGDKLAEAIALNNLGAVFADLHEWTEALENYEKAAEEVPDDASVEDRATPHGNAALAARQLRDWPKALYHTLYVDAIGTQAGDTDQQTVANAGVGIVRHSFPAEEFAAMIDTAIAELPEAMREFVRRDQHLNPTVVGDDRPGRNDPCYCGSGKKYKHCHLKTDREAADA